MEEELIFKDKPAYEPPQLSLLQSNLTESGSRPDPINETTFHHISS